MRKSTNGYVFMLGGAPVSWRAKKQELTAASSCEAEYIASFHASKEAIWLKRLLADLHPATRMSPIKLLIDNQGALAMAYNSAVNDRTKHIAIKYQFTREAVQRKVMTLEYCPTEHMVAEILTKPLERVKFQKLAQRLSLSSSSHLSSEEFSKKLIPALVKFLVMSCLIDRGGVLEVVAWSACRDYFIVRSSEPYHIVFLITSGDTCIRYVSHIVIPG